MNTLSAATAEAAGRLNPPGWEAGGWPGIVGQLLEAVGSAHDLSPDRPGASGFVGLFDLDVLRGWAADHIGGTAEEADAACRIQAVLKRLGVRAEGEVGEAARDSYAFALSLVEPGLSSVTTASRSG